MKFPRFLQHARLCALLLAVAPALQAAPQLPDFVYQGKLEQNGAPANGNFDLGFALFDAPAAGNPVGTPISLPAYPVVDGIFSTSLAFPGAFTGTQLYLEVSVNGTPMLPRQPVATAPVAQFSLSGTIAPGSVGSTELATFAVTNSKLAADSVSSSKILAGAVGTSELGNGVVTADKIATGAVGAAEIANDSIARGKIAGGYSNGAFAITIGANTCVDFNLSIGGAQVNDMILFSFQQGASVPPNLLFQPMRVPSDGLVAMRGCNVGNTAQSTGNLPIYLVTLR
ncbi:MAG TPA: hypothetical protein VLF18_08110 [Tahibacter sp.]|uniref:hypothetical protein n=1 Tax=Tahibacter sp. TaxID=2056211 RepID=UPI002C840802|nr:hypothetical protein [Tahibacter sp.]HSX60146.1 hypothetical protein [Tahibacter sp.]